MKLFTLTFLALLSFSSFAKSVEDAVSDVEFERDVKCTHLSNSKFGKCLGVPNSCFYSMMFRCDSAHDMFGLTVKVKEIYSFDEKGSKISVRSLKFTK